MAPSGKRFMSDMMSGILSPRKDETQNQFNSKSEDEGYVDISEADTLIDSEHESDKELPKGKHLSMTRSFEVEADSDENISIYDAQVYSPKRHFPHDEEVTSGDYLSPDDDGAKPPTETQYFKGLFDKFDKTTQADEEFETINPQEAEGADNERTARLKASIELVRRKHELRKAVPSPEQLRCPCLYDEKSGWERCPLDAHKELAKLMKMT